jgi:hypothetical protein
MTFIKQLTELYWSLGEYGIDDERRMKTVVREIAQEIRTWAPPETQARICYLMTHEIADRLLRTCTDPEWTAPTAPTPEPEETQGSCKLATTPVNPSSDSGSA